MLTEQEYGGEFELVEDVLYTPAEICKFLQISIRTFRRLVAEGRVPTVRIGGRLRVRARDLAIIMSYGL